MKNTKQTPTLEGIAKVAGVSRSTVSRVINEEPNVREDVRERVWRVVEELSYHPNAAARSLARHHSQILGVVIPQAVTFIFGDPFFPTLLQGISDAASEKDYHLMLSMLSERSAEKDFYRRALRSRMLDGVLISSALFDDPMIPQLIKDHTPFVVVGRTPQYPEVSYVDVDNRHGGQTATAHLIRQGRRRIAVITGPLRTIPSTDRLDGYQLALTEAGLPVDKSLIAEGDFTEVGGYVAMQKLLPEKPDAVFASSDLMALGALRAMRQVGICVPDDIALIGFDDAQVAAYMEPPLTTIRQPVYTLGATAFGLLLQLLESDTHDPLRTILPIELVVRRSCGVTAN